MTTSSAPAAAFLLGEHAVVYGEPALLAAVDRRATVTVRRREDASVRIDAGDLSVDGFTVEYGERESADDLDVELPAERLQAATAYVDAALAQARDVADAPDAGFEVAIESEIPAGAGLGSSAAVVVATLDAATRELGVELERDVLAERAYRVEHEVQDGEASRSDTFTATAGGVVRVQGDDCRSIEAPELPIVLGYDGGGGDTGELVGGVRTLRDRYDFAADTVGAIGDLVAEGERALAEDDRERLGEFMDVNQGLLAALGVSARSLDAMAWAAREAGATGAKLTGAGGGGCVVALADDAAGAERVETALSHTPACEAAFRAPLAETGVRRE